MASSGSRRCGAVTVLSVLACSAFAYHFVPQRTGSPSRHASGCVRVHYSRLSLLEKCKNAHRCASTKTRRDGRRKRQPWDHRPAQRLPENARTSLPFPPGAAMGERICMAQLLWQRGPPYPVPYSPSFVYEIVLKHQPSHTVTLNLRR